MDRLCFLIFISLASLAKATTNQYLDSVKKVYRETTDPKAKLYALYSLSFEYGLIQPKIGIDYGRKCLKLAKKEHNLAYQLNAYNGIANAFETLANYDSALYYHRLSHTVALQMNESPRIANTLVNVALSLKHLGLFQSALQKYLKAYEILRKQETYNPRIHFYLGELYLDLGDLPNAEKQSLLGIQMCRKFKHDYVILNFYVNLAKCKLRSKDYSQALKYLLFAKKGLKENTDLYSLGDCLKTLGNVYFLQNNYSKALQTYGEELTVCEQTENKNAAILANLNTAIIYGKPSFLNKSKVDFHIKEAEALIPFVKNNSDILPEIYQKLATCYEQMGNFKKAMYYLNLHTKSQEEVLSIAKVRQFNDLQMSYETEKKEHEISNLKQAGKIKSLQLKTKNEELNRRNLWIYSGLISFALLMLVLFVFYQRQRYRSQLEHEKMMIATTERERNRVARDLHDDLGSGLAKLRFLSESIEKEKELVVVQRKVKNLQETAHQLVENLRDLIWVMNSENNTLEQLTVRIREYISDYIDETDLTCEPTFNLENASFKLTTEQSRSLFSIVKECLQNTLKYAHATHFYVHLVQRGNQLTLQLRDNGIGNFDPNSSKGNGMKNLKVRVQKLSGVIDIDTSHGTTVKVSVVL